MKNDKPMVVDALLCVSGGLPIQCGYTQGSLPCIDLVQDALEQGVIQLGFDYVRYAYWLKHGVNTGKDAFSVNFNNFPPLWEECYNEESLYLIDPVVRFIQEGGSELTAARWQVAFNWAMAHPLGDSTADQEAYQRTITAFFQRASAAGLASGFLYAWGDHQRQIVLSLGSAQEHQDDVMEDPTCIQVLHSMVMLVNQAVGMTSKCTICRKPFRIAGQEILKLSEAELRILQLYYKNRLATQKIVAEECGRSVETVSHHLRSVRRKFRQSGASGHALAAYAAELNLL